MGTYKRLQYLDLFSGAGGLSEGFMRSGFSPVAHVEIDVHACKTIETRLVYHLLKRKKNLLPYYRYLKEKITRCDFIKGYGNFKITNSVINELIGKNNKSIYRRIDKALNGSAIDVIIGGPPCQAYSLVGRARDENGMIDDPRNYLYKEYAKFVKRYRPKVFVFENVIGLLTANGGCYFKNMKAYFKRIGYKFEYTIQKSEDFGVLQKRRRLILIGWEKISGFKYPQFSKISNEFSVREIFSDLKIIDSSEQKNITQYTMKATDYLKKFGLRDRNEFVTQHITRPHNERDLSIYKIAINKWMLHKERLKYPDLPKELKTHKNEKLFMDRYKVVDLNGLSHTVVAHIAKDGHYYIYPDSKQVRSLSVREAARIQSFPDNFYFEGGRTAAFKQIGNAVPPLMAEAIAKKIKEQIDE